MNFRLSHLLLVSVLVCVSFGWLVDRLRIEQSQQELRLKVGRLNSELLLHHKKRSVRYESIKRLRELGSMESVESLIFSLSDPDQDIRHVARETLESLSGKSFFENGEEDVTPAEIMGWKRWAYENALLVRGDDIDQAMDASRFRSP